MIESLREALSLSPTNLPLRLLLADHLLKASLLDEAESEFRTVLTQDTNNKTAKRGLSKIYFEQKKYSTAIVILEELAEQENDVDLWILLSKASLRNEEPAKAIEYYKRALALNSAYKDEELDNNLKQGSNSNPSMDAAIESIEEEMREFERPSINFEDVGGMERVKEEINIKIIQPLQHPDLYKAYGKKIGGGILLYGPPGCGKTHLARATAGQIKASFISIGIHDVLNMWLGNSERRLHELFETARRQTPCLLFFDEIDALGASRTDMRQSSAKMLINQFLMELDGVDYSNDGILVLGATNAPWHLDSAFRRPGRFDRIIFVQPPDVSSRESILKITLKDKPTKDIDYKAIAKETPDFSGADLKGLIDVVIEDKLRDSFKSGIPQPITSKDILKAVKQVRPSTKEWFNSARNYALYANESGLYDDILDYMKIKK